MQGARPGAGAGEVGRNVMPAFVCGSTVLALSFPHRDHLASVLRLRCGSSWFHQQPPGEDLALLPNIGSYFVGRDLAHCVTLDRRPNLPGLNGMLLTNTRSRPFEITIPVPLQLFFEHLERFLLSGTSHVTEEISLDQRSPVFRNKEACEATELDHPAAGVVALFGSVEEEPLLDLIHGFNALGRKKWLHNRLAHSQAFARV